MTIINAGKLALDFLTIQRLDPTPTNYHLAYVHVTGGAPVLSAEIGNITDGGVRLRQSEADELLEKYLGAPAAAVPPPAPDGGAALREQVLLIARIAAETGQATTDFGRELQDNLEAVQSGSSTDVAKAVLKMIQRAAASERQLASVSKKVEELREKLEAARDDASKDALTNLPNRRGIERYLSELTGARAIAFCDVDHFKHINDSYGHDVGDRVLVHVARRLQELCAGHFVGRYGGEEFLVVVKNASASDAALIIDDARAAIAGTPIRLRDSNEKIGNITFSAGVSSAEDAEAAIKEADDLLYQAKGSGRNRVVAAHKVRRAA